LEVEPESHDPLQVLGLGSLPNAPVDGGAGRLGVEVSGDGGEALQHGIDV